MNSIRRVAIITGASRGIGKGISSLFASQSISIAGISRNKEVLDKTISSLPIINNKNQIHKAYVCDVSDKVSLQNTIQQIERDFGSIDILVNAAGIVKNSLLIKEKESEVNQLIQTNLLAPMWASQAVLKGMIQRKEGKILSIGSVVGIMGNQGQTSYSMSKAGLVGFTKSLAKEVASRNILVNLIAPGFIETDMTQHYITDTLNSASTHQSYLSKIPLGKFGSIEDVASTALFLIDSKYITGQVIVVDGGLSL